MQKLLTAVIALIFISNSVLADSGEGLGAPVVNNLDELVVTGTGTPHHLKTAPVPTELYTSQEIEKVGAVDFTDLMTKISPSFDFTPSGMGGNMKFNGLGGDFVVVLINGKRMAGDIGGMVDLSRINVANIERIEVVKGASSSLYGSDAIGGVINIITKKNSDKINFVNQSNYSSYNTLLQDNSLSYNVGKLSGTTHVAYNKTDGWKNSPYETDGDSSLVETSEMSQNAYENYTVDQSLSYDITDDLTVSGDISYYNKELYYPEDVKKYNYKYNDLSYNVSANYALDSYDNINVNFHSDRFTYIYKYNQASGDYTKGDEVEQNQQLRNDANVNWTKHISDNNTFMLGAEYVGETYISEGRLSGDEVSAYSAALYGQEELTFFNALDVIAGVRLTQHQDFGVNLSPKLSLLYRFDNINLRSTYSRGFKAPTLKELNYRYEKGSKLYLGNTNLEAQTSDYYTVGADYYNDFFTASASAYINNVEGLITYKEIETSAADAENGIGTTKQHFNLDRAETKGLEASFNVNLPAGFSLGAAYSYVDAVGFTKKDDGTFSEERLEYVAHHYFNANANYSKSWENYQLGVSFIAKAQDEKYYKKAKNGLLPGFKLYNLATTHKFAQMGLVSLSAKAGVDNLFDYVENTPLGLSHATLTPGRTYYAGLIINLSQKE